MFKTRIVLVSALSAMLCVNASAADQVTDDLDMSDDKSITETGDWSEKSIARGKNKDINDKSLETLPPSLRQIWASKPEAADRQKKDRRKTLSNEVLVDEIIPAYGVQYVTEQRNFSRAEKLWLDVHKFLTDVNIRVMAGELGRRGPQLTNPERVKGEKTMKGDVALVEQEPLPEEVQIQKYHEALITLRGLISYPNLLEREHFNEIAGDLAKAQGLLNYDLTEDGIKRIDEQFAAWRVLIEAARLRAVEAYAEQLMAENPKLTVARARQQAEKAEIEFKYPPLPMGAHALRDARAELNRMHEVRSPQKTNAKQKARDEAKEKEKTPTILEVDGEKVDNSDADTKAEETVEEAVEEKVDTTEEVTEDLDVDTNAMEKAPEADLDVEIEEFDVDADEDETKEAMPAEEEEVEEAPAVEEEMETEEVEEATEEAEEKTEKKEDDEESFEFEDDFDFE